MYSNNNSSQYLPSYPPRPESSYEEHKHHYDEDIIDSYASSEVQLPTKPYQSYPAKLSYDRQEGYPAHSKNKSIFSGRTGLSDTETVTFDGGGGTYGPGANGKEPQETKTLWQTVSSLAEKPFAQVTCFFQLLPDSLACRLYVLTVIIETIVDIAVESDLLLRVRTVSGSGDLGTQRLPVYLSIFVFAQ